MRFRTPELIPVIFICCATLLLAGLGVWQLQRLEQKQALLDRMDAAQNLPILGTLPADPEAAEYRRAQLAGEWVAGRQLRMIGQKSSGYVWLAPFRLEDSGQVILASLGWFPAGTETAPLPEGPLKGWLRLPRGKRLFAPDNEPEKNLWLTEDIAAMSGATALSLYPLILEPSPPPPLWNPHLGYAATWFLLAAAGLIMFAIYHRVPEPKNSP